MSDPDAEAERRRRQAPRYGEYATPEEVAAIRGPDAPPLVPIEAAPPSPPTGRPIPGVAPPGHVRSAGWDGILTIALLAFGAYNVVQGIASFADMPAFLAEVARAADSDGFTSPTAAQPVGYGLIALWAVLFTIAVVWSVQRLRHGRSAFWVPILVGFVGFTIAVITLLILLSGASGLDMLQNQG